MPTTLDFELRNFIGTEHYYKTAFGNLLYTDGIQFLAERAGAHWLVDAIASYQPDYHKVDFQLWTLSVNQKGNATLTMREDDGEEALITQEISYTDFPFGIMKLYVEGNVLMLPSER